MFDILKEKKTFLFAKMVQLLETTEGLSLEHAFDMHTRQRRALPSQPGAHRPSPKRGALFLYLNRPRSWYQATRDHAPSLEPSPKLCTLPAPPSETPGKA